MSHDTTDTIPATLTREAAEERLLDLLGADHREKARPTVRDVLDRAEALLKSGNPDTDVAAILRALIAGQAAAPSQPAATTGGLCLTHGAYDTRHGCPGCAAQPAQGASLEADERVSLECRGCGVIDSVDAGISAFLCSECTAEGKTHEALDAEERGGSLEVRARAAWDAYRQTPFTGLSFGNDEPNLPRWIAVVRAVDASRPAETGTRPETECTGDTASWCPRCGDCSCPYLNDNPDDGRTLDDPSCPLHASTSAHATEPDPPRFVWRGSESDLATDIRGALTADQIAKLADELRPSTATLATARPALSEERCSAAVREGYCGALNAQGLACTLRPGHPDHVAEGPSEVLATWPASRGDDGAPGAEVSPWDGPRRYRSDDRDLAGHDVDLVIAPPEVGGNGDWYVAIVPHSSKPWMAVRVTTSGAPRDCEGFFVALAKAYEKLPPNKKGSNQ